MRSLNRLIAETIPINSFTKERIEKPVVPSPEVGIRWGAASEFEYSTENPADDAPNVEIYDLEEEIEIVGVEVKRAYEEIRIENPQDESQYIETEGVKKVIFDIGVREVRTEETESVGNVTFVQPIIEYVQEYLHFEFAAVPEAVGAGGRGDEPPPDTPEAPKAPEFQEASQNGG